MALGVAMISGPEAHRCARRLVDGVTAKGVISPPQARAKRATGRRIWLVRSRPRSRHTREDLNGPYAEQIGTFADGTRGTSCVPLAGANPDRLERRVQPVAADGAAASL